MAGLPVPPTTLMERERTKAELRSLLDKVPSKEYFVELWADVLEVKKTQEEVCIFIRKVYDVCPHMRPACNDGVHCGEDKEIKEVKIIKAKTKMYMTLSKYWWAAGLVVIGIVLGYAGGAGYL